MLAAASVGTTISAVTLPGVSGVGGDGIDHEAATAQRRLPSSRQLVDLELCNGRRPARVTCRSNFTVEPGVATTDGYGVDTTMSAA